MVAITKLSLVVSLAGILPALAAPIRAEGSLTKNFSYAEQTKHTPPEIPSRRDLALERRLEVRSSSGSGSKEKTLTASRANSLDLKTTVIKAPGRTGTTFVHSTPKKDADAAGPMYVFYNGEDSEGDKETKAAEKRKWAQSSRENVDAGQGTSSSWRVMTPTGVQSGGGGKKGAKGRAQSLNVVTQSGQGPNAGENNEGAGWDRRKPKRAGSMMDLDSILNRKSR